MLRGVRAPFPIAPRFGVRLALRQARDLENLLIVCGCSNSEMVPVTGVSSYPPLFPSYFKR